MDLLSTIRQLDREAAQFLLSDAATAHVLLDEADTNHSGGPDVQRAREGLGSLNRFLAVDSVEADQRTAVQAARDKLQARLERIASGAP